MSTKQLYEKTSEGMKEVSPLVSIEDIYSKLSDTPLEALVSLFNHVKCEWKGSVADFPDDEDIASVDNMLKFKDREVDVANF